MKQNLRIILQKFCRSMTEQNLKIARVLVQKIKHSKAAQNLKIIRILLQKFSHTKTALILKITLFVLIFASLFQLFTYAFTAPQYEKNYLEYAAEPKDSIDVLFFGNSQVFCALSPMEIWNTNGITSYVLATPLRFPADSLVWISEAIRTQKPKVIVLNLSHMVYNLPQSFEWLVWAYAPLPLSFGKLSSIMQYTPSEQWSYLMFNLFNFHNEWQSGFETLSSRFVARAKPGLTESTRTLEKGFVFETAHIPQTRNEEVMAISPEKFDFALRIIEVARKYSVRIGAKLVLLQLPEPNAVTNALANQLAEEYKEDPFVTVLNINESPILEKIGIDFAWDFSDGFHLNYVGGTKVSQYVGEYLSTEFLLPDRRNEAGVAYDTWRQDSKNYQLRLTELSLHEN